MTVKHTPGPYTFVTPGLTTQNVRGRKVEILTDDHLVPIAHVYTRKRHRGKLHNLPVIHNARLLGASFDLLAALESVEWVLVPGGWGSAEWECPWCEQRKPRHADSCSRQAAIAKATGGDA